MNKLRFIFIFFVIILFSCFGKLESSQEDSINNDIIYNIEENGLFLFIPSEEIMVDYMNFFLYLLAWDKNEVDVDNESATIFFENYIGIDSLHSLLFESFLRYTKNQNIRTSVINYFDIYEINTSFSNSLRKLYASKLEIVQSGGNEKFRYNYNDLEYDENINLFYFEEINTFNHEIGLLLFDNNWDMISYTNPDITDMDTFTLIYGGGTNSITVTFSRYLNIDENNIESKFNLTLYNERYADNWFLNELQLEGILNRAGAERYIISHGIGSDFVINSIETGTFNAYLYNKDRNTLYLISYYMNFSPLNIHFSERNRIFNLLLFNLLFVFTK